MIANSIIAPGKRNVVVHKSFKVNRIMLSLNALSAFDGFNQYITLFNDARFWLTRPENIAVLPRVKLLKPICVDIAIKIKEAILTVAVTAFSLKIFTDVIYLSERIADADIITENSRNARLIPKIDRYFFLLKFNDVLWISLYVILSPIKILGKIISFNQFNIKNDGIVTVV